MSITAPQARRHLRGDRVVTLTYAPRKARGYLLTEALVYIGAVVVLLAAGLVAMYRCIDNSLVLRRNAEQITHTMHIGELWRADMRTATNAAQLVQSEAGQILRLEKAVGTVEYRFADGSVYRRTGSGPWARVLEKVKSSSMHSEARSQVTAWHWDIELLPQSRGAVGAARVRPLFSFIAAARVADQG